MLRSNGSLKVIFGTPLFSTPRPWEILPIGGVMVSAYEILAKRSIAEFRGRKLRQYLGLRDDMELWIDSGGYQFLMRGENVPLEKLARLYREIEADYYVSLDYPPPPRANKRERAVYIAKTVNAYLKLRSLVGDLVEEGKLVPVFHLSTGRSLEVQLSCYEQTAFVASVGGLVPYFMQRAGRGSRLKALYFLSLIRRKWSGRLHALGLASPAIISLLEMIGIDSSDTQSWRHKAAYGKIVLPGLGERHISGRRVSFGPAKLKEEERKTYLGFIEMVHDKLGISEDMLREDFNARALFNAFTLLEVARNGYMYLGGNRAFGNLYKEAERIASLEIGEIEEELGRLLKQD